MVAGGIQKGSLAGSLISAFMASACCLGPVLLSFLGLGSASFLMRFEEYRPELIGAAVFLLATAGFFTFRKSPTADCVTGTACASPRAVLVNKVAFWIAGALVGLMIFYPTIVARMSD